MKREAVDKGPAPPGGGTGLQFGGGTSGRHFHAKDPTAEGNGKGGWGGARRAAWSHGGDRRGWAVA